MGPLYGETKKIKFRILFQKVSEEKMKGMENIDHKPLKELSDGIWKLIIESDLQYEFTWGVIAAISTEITLMMGLKKEAALEIMSNTYDREKKKKVAKNG